MRVVRQCVASDETVDVRSILTTLAALRRPIALHVRESSTLLEWLRDRQAGRFVYRSASDAVWLIDAVTLRAAAAVNDADGTVVSHDRSGARLRMRR